MICSLTSIWVESQVLPLKEQMNFTEGRPLHLVSLPALGHKVTDFTRAVAMGIGQENSRSPFSPHVGEAGKDFGIALTFVGLFSGKRKNFPQRHPECPHVTFGGKFALESNAVQKVGHVHVYVFALPVRRTPKPSIELATCSLTLFCSSHFCRWNGSCQNRIS